MDRWIWSNKNGKWWTLIMCYYESFRKSPCYISVRYSYIDTLLPQLLLLLMVILIVIHFRWHQLKLYYGFNTVSEKPLIGWCMWATEWLKSTPLKRAQHISRISFISVACYTSPGKERIHHVTGWPIMKRLDFLSRHNGVLSSFRLKRSPGAAWQDDLCVDTNSLCLPMCFSKEYTRQSVR